MARRGIVVRYGPGAVRRLPRVPAAAYVIADAGTGAVLAARDPHGLYPPASTLKVLTAVTMIPLLSPDAMVRASRRAASVQPNVVGLVPGRRYRVADLMRAMLMISANDAAVALVEASGSFRRGIGLMTSVARRLQAYDVVVRDPNGLPAAGQVVSAYDLALIARQALAMPAFLAYDATRAARFRVTGRKRVTLVNQNDLITRYRGGLGGKIGWTSAAAATYVGLARRHGVTLIVTILHCTPLHEITAAERLLNWGFAADGRVSPAGVLVPPLPRRRGIRGAGGPAGLRAVPAWPPAAGWPGRSLPAGIAAGGGAVATAAVAALVMARLRRRGRRPRNYPG